MKLVDIWATLRTFSLSEDSFPVIIGNVALLLRTLTINIYKNNESASWIFYLTTLVGGVGYFYVFLLSSAWMVFVRYTISENFAGIALAICYTMCTVTGVTKLICIMLQVSYIRETIQKYLTLDAKIKPGTRFALNLRKYLRVVKKRALLIWICLVNNGVTYLLIPLLSTNRHFGQGLFILYGLEPILESPNYEIGHILNAIGTLFCVYVIVNVAVFVIVLVGYNEALLYAMCEELNILWQDSQDFVQESVNTTHAFCIRQKIVNEYIRKRLTTIVYYHVTNIQLFKELNNQLSVTLLIEYGIMIIAIIAALLGGLENTYLQVPYTTVQIYINCLSGQRLVDACEEFERAIYNCEWENFNVSNRKTILLMLVASQKTLRLSAGGMANLNFVTLMSIFKASYSAYTALKSSMQ